MGNIFGGDSIHHTKRHHTGGAKKKRRAKSLRKTSRSGKGKHPKKGQRSRTRRNRLDFVTHRGNVAFNARGHRQYRKRKPYTRRR